MPRSKSFKTPSFKTPSSCLLIFPLFLFLFGLMLLGCSPERDADLQITYLKDGERVQKTYQCRGKSCDVLNGIIWREVFPGEICAEGYGGGDLVKIQGKVSGTPVKTEFIRTNMCEIARFNSLRPLLNRLDIWGGKKEGIQSFSEIFQFNQASQKIANLIPQLGIHIANAILLFFLWVFLYIWITAIKKSQGKKRLLAFFPPWGIWVYLEDIWKKGKQFYPSVLLDSAIIIFTLFLPFPVTLLLLILIIYLETDWSQNLKLSFRKSLTGENKEG